MASGEVGGRIREVRGRDASYLAPPAQIRTSPIRAYGSHLGCVTARRDILTKFRMRFSACDAVPRYCARPVLCWLTFPLGPRPWLHQLRSRLPGLVRRLHSYYGRVRLLMIVHHRLRLLAFPTRTSAARMLALADHEISRFPSKERAHMPVSKTTPGRLGARIIAPIRVAFRHRNDVGTREEGTFAAQWLAYALPCQRFANTLTGICA